MQNVSAPQKDSSLQQFKQIFMLKVFGLQFHFAYG